MVFSAIAAYVTKAAAPFDSLWKNFIVPLGEGIGSLLNSAVEHFGEVADENANALAEWGQAIKGILTNLGGLFKALGTVKTVLAPLITALFKVFEIFSCQHDYSHQLELKLPIHRPYQHLMILKFALPRNDQSGT